MNDRSITNHPAKKPLTFSDDPADLIAERKACESVSSWESSGRDKHSRSEEEQRYRTLFEFSPSGYIVEDAQGRILDANPAACQSLGYSREELVGMNAMSLNADGDVQGRSHIREILRQGNLFHEVRSRRKDGSIAYMNLRETKIRLSDGADGILVVCDDVTEKKLAQERLRESEKRLALAMEASSDGLWDWNLKTGEVYFSPRYYTMLGFEPNELPQKLDTWKTLIHPNDRDEVIAYELKQIQQKREFFRVEFRMQTKFGGWKWILSRGKVVEWDEEGCAVRMVGTHTDMTHRKEAENKLRTMASQLALTEERQRRALAQDLHDHVGQLLSTGKLKLQSLRRKTKEQENLPRIEEIISLLEESIQDVKSMTFQLSPSILFDLGFEVALEWLLEQFEKKHGLRCSLKDDGCGKHISDDLKAILFRSVRELMMNVVKHAKARNVSVRTWGELGCVLIRVSDDGVGFETATLNAADGSKGFGIFSIREQMAHLGGWLTVESQPGAGTAVTLRVPSSTPAEEEGS